MKRTSLVMLFAALLLASIAHADDKPLFDPSRLSLAMGTQYDWFAGSNTESGIGLPVNEFSAGPVGAYNLLAKEYIDQNGGVAYKPLLSLSGSVMYGLDSKQLRTSLGLRLMLYNGGN